MSKSIKSVLFRKFAQSMNKIKDVKRRFWGEGGRWNTMSGNRRDLPLNYARGILSDCYDIT